jgi:hypothetical protein
VSNCCPQRDNLLYLLCWAVVDEVIRVPDWNGRYALGMAYTQQRKIPKYDLQLLQEALSMEKQ